MLAPFFQSTITSHLAQCGPAFIAAGLAILLAASRSPAMPVVTAMSLVALGATMATIARFRSAAALRSVVATHLFVYTSLYVLIVGAVCHAAMTGPLNGITLRQGLDFGVSAAVMMWVVRLSVAAITGGGDAPAR